MNCFFGLKKKERDKQYGFEFELVKLDWDEVRALVEEVLTNEHLYIGENGRTYYE